MKCMTGNISNPPGRDSIPSIARFTQRWLSRFPRINLLEWGSDKNPPRTRARGRRLSPSSLSRALLPPRSFLCLPQNREKVMLVVYVTFHVYANPSHDDFSKILQKNTVTRVATRGGVAELSRPLYLDSPAYLSWPWNNELSLVL